MPSDLALYVFTRIVGIGFLFVVMGFVVDRYLTARHYKRANG